MVLVPRGWLAIDSLFVCKTMTRSAIVLAEIA